MDTLSTSKSCTKATPNPPIRIIDLKSRSSEITARALTTPKQTDVFELSGRPKGRATVEIQHSGAFNTLAGDSLKEMIAGGNAGLDSVNPGIRYEILRATDELVRVEIVDERPRVTISAEDSNLILTSGSAREYGNVFYIGAPVDGFGFTATRNSTLHLSIEGTPVRARILKGDTAHDVRRAISDALPAGYRLLPDGQGSKSPAARVAIVKR